MPPVIAVSMGDPSGIGPEVCVKALADASFRARGRFVILGLGSSLERAAREAGVQPYWAVRAPGDSGEAMPGVTLVDSELDAEVGRQAPFKAADSALGGRLSLAWVERACDMAKGADATLPRARAIVTAPISKAAWAMAGEFKHPGHTGLLAARFGVTRYAMMFASDLMNVILVTDHLPLKLVPRAVTSWLVRDVIELGAQGCRDMGIERPRVAVCGLNPHAGEGGLLGEEESQDIAPAIEQARARGVDAEGPFPADTIFAQAMDQTGRPRRFDLVVSMYHDQGLIPVKLLARDSAVNMTVGLPVPRTSPDHGTAYDIAHQGRANPGSMKAALELALILAKRRETS